MLGCASGSCSSEESTCEQEHAEVQNILDAYFGPRTSSKDDAFLHNFLKKRLWTADDDDGAVGDLAHDDDADAVQPIDEDEDEQFLDNADDFERQYNFRCVSGPQCGTLMFLGTDIPYVQNICLCRSNRLAQINTTLNRYLFS